jgi:ribosomal protein L34E
MSKYERWDNYQTTCSDCMSPISSIMTTRHRSTVNENYMCGQCARSYTGNNRSDMYDYLEKYLDNL